MVEKKARDEIFCALQVLDVGNDLVRLDGEVEVPAAGVSASQFCSVVSFTSWRNGSAHFHSVDFCCVTGQKFFSAPASRGRSRLPVLDTPIPTRLRKILAMSIADYSSHRFLGGFAQRRLGQTELISSSRISGSQLPWASRPSHPPRKRSHFPAPALPLLGHFARVGQFLLQMQYRRVMTPHHLQTSITSGAPQSERLASPQARPADSPDF